MILSLKNCTRNFKRSFILKKDIELSSLNKIFYLKIDYIPLWLFCDYLSFAQVVSKMYSEPQRSDSKLYSEPQKKSSNRFCGAQILFANYLCSTIFWVYGCISLPPSRGSFSNNITLGLELKLYLWYSLFFFCSSSSLFLSSEVRSFISPKHKKYLSTEDRSFMSLKHKKYLSSEKRSFISPKHKNISILGEQIVHVS